MSFFANFSLVSPLLHCLKRSRKCVATYTKTVTVSSLWKSSSEEAGEKSIISITMTMVFSMPVASRGCGNSNLLDYVIQTRWMVQFVLIGWCNLNLYDATSWTHRTMNFWLVGQCNSNLYDAAIRTCWMWQFELARYWLIAAKKIVGASIQSIVNQYIFILMYIMSN